MHRNYYHMALVILALVVPTAITIWGIPALSLIALPCLISVCTLAAFTLDGGN